MELALSCCACHASALEFTNEAVEKSTKAPLAKGNSKIIRMSPLTDLERDIARKVVNRFVKHKLPTSKRSLIREFREPDVIERLVSRNLFRSSGNNQEDLLPGALTFYYSGDLDVLKLVKNGLEIVTEALQGLFDAEMEQEEFNPADVAKRILKTRGFPPVPEELWLGLYLVPEFNFLSSYGSNPAQTEVVAFRISTKIVTVKSFDEVWDREMRIRVGYFEGRETTLTMDTRKPMVNIASRKVFVVHGHDEAVKEAVARFLTKLDLEPVILHEQPNMGRTIIEKFEAHANVGFAVVLLTPDDACGATRSEQRKRARQNVVLELGYFMGKLGRLRVCALYVGGVELPSDVNGVLYVPYDEGGGWRLKLAGEIRAAGIDVDLNRI